MNRDEIIILHAKLATQYDTYSIGKIISQTTEQETIARCEAYLRSRGFSKLAKDMKAELSK